MPSVDGPGLEWFLSTLGEKPKGLPEVLGGQRRQGPAEALQTGAEP